jgi:transcriptional/translational regulatory protein YebC/TACO1
LCVSLTDNRNRTAPEIRKIFEVCGGKLGATGCVAWNFDRKGMFIVSLDATDEETLMDLVLEAGADDFVKSDDGYEITCQPDHYQAVSEALTAAGIEPEASQLGLVPKDQVEIRDPDTAAKILKLMDLLDDHEDVQNVSSNFNIPDDVMEQLGR